MSLTESQEQILDAAMSCISRDGIEGASMRSVAREADVSLGLLSYHFDGKEDLIQAAFQLACDRVFDVTLAAVDATDDASEQVYHPLEHAHQQKSGHCDNKVAGAPIAKHKPNDQQDCNKDRDDPRRVDPQKRAECLGLGGEIGGARGNRIGHAGHTLKDTGWSDPM